MQNCCLYCTAGLQQTALTVFSTKNVRLTFWSAEGLWFVGHFVCLHELETTDFINRQYLNS